MTRKNGKTGSPAGPTAGSSAQASERNSTQIDLGDDLIASARRAKSAPSDPQSQGHVIEDLLQNARILHSEGLNDEAKKVLRRILIADPRNAAARQALHGIQEQELRGILDGSSSERVRLGSPGHGPPVDDLPVQEADIVASLDRELGLGLLGEERNRLPPDEAGLDRFLSDMETALVGCAGRDRIDLGIAFLEMGSPEVAEHCFRVAQQAFLAESEPGLPGSRPAAESARLALAATALIAQALLSSGRPLEALHTIQHALKTDDSGEIVWKQEARGGAAVATRTLHDGQIELLYLLGRATEVLGQLEEARIWYRKVFEIEPGYRDTGDRLRPEAGPRPRNRDSSAAGSARKRDSRRK